VKPSIWFTNLSYTLASLILAFFQFFERLLDDYLCRILMRLSAFSWKRWFSTALFSLFVRKRLIPHTDSYFFCPVLGMGLNASSTWNMGNHLPERSRLMINRLIFPVGFYWDFSDL